MHVLYATSLILAIFSNLIVLAIIIRRATSSVTLSMFVLFILLINAWAIPQLLLILFSFNEQLFIAIDKISAFGYVFLPVSFSLFALAYIGKIRMAKEIGYIVFVYAPALVFLYFAWNSDLIEVRNFASVIKTSWGYSVPTGALFPIFALWFELVSLFSLANIFKMYAKTADTKRRKQAILVMIAMLIPLCIGTFTNAILPILHIPFFPLGIPLTSLTAGIITYAVLKYGLFEVDSSVLLSSIANGIIVTDAEQKIVHMNATAKKLLKVQKNTFLGKSLHQIVTIRQINAKREIDPIRLIFQKRSTIISSDIIIDSRFAAPFSVECTISPLYQSDLFKGITIMFRNNTREKEMEKNKNEFIGIASHELRTPLTSIIAFSQVLEKNILREKNTQYLPLIKSINVQLQKMHHLIDDLLNAVELKMEELLLTENTLT